MRRTSSAIALLAVAGLAACGTETVAPDAGLTPRLAVSAPSGDGSGTYVVRFKGNGVPAGFAEKVSALGGQVVFAHAGVGIGAVSGLDDVRAGQLGRTSGIASVDADVATLLDPVAPAVPEATSSIESPANPATALRFSRQWNMKVIAADAAWADGKRGNSSVKVGIIDTGIDHLHPDLVNRVDMVLSRSFLSAAENARVTSIFGAATPLWVDLNYHGTHVAATVASNAYIYAGVTSETKLVALKVCTPGTAANGFRGSCPTSGVLGAVLYAADNGIPIVNMSLGGYFDRRDASAKGGVAPSFIAIINQVMNYANRNGTTVVVSAGNGDPATGLGIDLDADGNSYKAYCSAPSVICVSATGPTGAAAGFNGPWTNIDALASYSNFGRSAISVAAPGGNAVAVTAACSGFTIHSGLLVCRNRFFNSPTSWSAFSVGLAGTSMAAPHVSGVAALIAANGTVNPGSVRAAVANSADDLGPPGNDPAYGRGRVNAGRAAGAI